jgi:hypothetical protein
MNAIIWMTLSIGIVGFGLLLALLIEKIGDRFGGDPLPSTGTADQTPNEYREPQGESFENFQTERSRFHGLEIGDFIAEEGRCTQSEMDRKMAGYDEVLDSENDELYENEQWLL